MNDLVGWGSLLATIGSVVAFIWTHEGRWLGTAIVFFVVMTLAAWPDEKK